MLVILLIFALICDLRTDRVPNVLILLGYGTGMANFVIKYGMPGILWCVFAIIAVCLCFLPVYTLGGLGGGDCKLLAWIVLFFNVGQVLECYMFIFLCGGMIAVIKFITVRKRTFHFTAAVFLGVIAFGMKVYFVERGGGI